MDEVLTGGGRFRGTLEGGVKVFRGITFARCSRFGQAVLEPAAGQCIDAVSSGSITPQRSSRLSALFGDERKAPEIDEGRLCLSVYSPERASNLPVMVWIHGGAFLTGGSEEPRYGCERLVRTADVVVVKISYRLGAFGYLYLPDEGICNLGLEDQRTALQWIHENIAEFGGNPDDVTLFGQSAGALSIAALIATCEGKPLFHRAILQSAPLGIKMSGKEASRISKAFLRHLGKDPREATLDEMLDAQQKVAGMKFGLTFMPVVPDFMAIPESVKASGLSVIAGFTAEDASPFMKFLGPIFDSTAGRALIHLGTKKTFISPTMEYIGRLRSCGLEASEYYITWHPEGNPYGACHCIELPFLLGDREDWLLATMLQGMTDAEFESGSRELLAAWTSFATKGIFPYGKMLKRYN